MKRVESFDNGTDIRKIFPVEQIIFVRDGYSRNINPFYVDEKDSTMRQMYYPSGGSEIVFALESDVINKLLESNGLRLDNSHLILIDETMYKGEVTAPLYEEVDFPNTSYYYKGKHNMDIISPKGFCKLLNSSTQFHKDAFDTLFNMNTLDNGTSAVIKGTYTKGVFGYSEKYISLAINWSSAIYINKKKCKQNPVITVPKKLAGQVIGNRGNTINSLSSKVGVNIKVETL